MTGNERPRIFHLITRLLKGGAEAKTISTVTGIEGYEFTVGFGSSFDPDQVSVLESQGVKTRRFPLIRHYNPFTSVPAVFSVAMHLRRNDYDLVHTHSTEAGIIGRLAAVLADVPHIVHTVHGVPISSDRNEPLNRFILTCERFAAKYTDRIITNADIIADEYLEYGIGNEQQYRTIYSGVKLEEFQEASPRLDIPGTRPRVAMIGRLAPGKGFDLLLEAADTVVKVGGSICIVGEGPLFQELSEEIERRGLSDTIHMTGFREDIPNILAASDVLVLPSYREGTPRVITEAMAAGLPVVATNIAGIPEQVADGESGLLIPTGDPQALESSLGDLLRDEALRERMGSEGRQRSSKFSQETMLSELDDLYQTLLD